MHLPADTERKSRLPATRGRTLVAVNDIDAVLEFWLEPKPTTPAENDAAWQKWFFTSSAELDRTSEDGRGDRVVDRDAHRSRMRDVAHRPDVGDVPHGIGRGLEPQQSRPTWPDGLLHRSRIGGIDELDVESPGHAELRQPLANAPVQNAGYEDVIARQ